MQPDQILCDRYQLRHLLGKAPGRQTWLAQDLAKQPAEAVVVKLLAFSELIQWDDFKLFEREAQVLQQLQHPRIPRYRDSFNVGESPCWFGLVQDYIPGASLKQLLEDGDRFNEKQVLQMATDVLELLSYLHELSPPVLHRDIKPSNLILGEDGDIYLVDFGAVQERAAREGVTFTVVGTYGYAPLEQFGGRAVPASDLYGLGATLIYLLTGVAPAELPQQDLRIQFRDRVSISPTLASWIEKLVEPDVAKRFQSAQEALSALRSPTSVDRSQNASTTHSTKSLYPPHNTRIEVRRSSKELLIKLPGNNPWQLLLLSAIALLVVGYAFAPVFLYLVVTRPATLFFCIVMALLFVPILITAIHWKFLPTFVHFQEDNFSIYKRIANRPSVMHRGSIKDIENVFHAFKTLNASNSGNRVVVIQTWRGETIIGSGLSRQECSWLVSVIQDWLAQR